MPLRTLIFNGSPKAHGDTAALIHMLSSHLDGEVRVASMDDGIGPCVDCRHCWTKPGCALRDGMQDVYPYLEECDNLVLATPIWFSQVSGPLLCLMSRVQTYFCAQRFRRETPPIRPKKSALLLAGGEPGTEEKAIAACRTMLKFVNALPIVAIVRSMNTNHLPAAQDEEAMAMAKQAAKLLNA